jgi:hypothetical protein
MYSIIYNIIDAIYSRYFYTYTMQLYILYIACVILYLVLYFIFIAYSILYKNPMLYISLFMLWPIYSIWGQILCMGHSHGIATRT